MTNTATATKTATKPALSSATVIEALQAKGYTETQIVNSLKRKLNHVEKTASAQVKGVYRKALATARTNLAAAHADHFVPCDVQCLTSAIDECVCHCGGKNHGAYLKANA